MYSKHVTIIKEHNNKIFQKETQETLILAAELRPTVPSMVIGERNVSNTNVQQQSVTRKKYILDRLKKGLESIVKSTRKIAKSFKNKFYGNSTNLLSNIWKKKKCKKCNIGSYMRSLTSWGSIFQQNKKMFFMPPPETNDHYSSIFRWTSEHMIWNSY